MNNKTVLSWRLLTEAGFEPRAFVRTSSHGGQWLISHATGREEVRHDPSSLNLVTTIRSREHAGQETKSCVVKLKDDQYPRMIMRAIDDILPVFSKQIAPPVRVELMFLDDSAKGISWVSSKATLTSDFKWDRHKRCPPSWLVDGVPQHLVGSPVATNVNEQQFSFSLEGDQKWELIGIPLALSVHHPREYKFVDDEDRKYDFMGYTPTVLLHNYHRFDQGGYDTRAKVSSYLLTFPERYIKLDETSLMELQPRKDKFFYNRGLMNMNQETLEDGTKRLIDLEYGPMSDESNFVKQRFNLDPNSIKSTLENAIFESPIVILSHPAFQQHRPEADELDEDLELPNATLRFFDMIDLTDLEVQEDQEGFAYTITGKVTLLATNDPKQKGSLIGFQFQEQFAHSRYTFKGNLETSAPVATITLPIEASEESNTDQGHTGNPSETDLSVDTLSRNRRGLRMMSEEMERMSMSGETESSGVGFEPGSERIFIGSDIERVENEPDSERWADLDTLFYTVAIEIV